MPMLHPPTPPDERAAFDSLPTEGTSRAVTAVLELIHGDPRHERERVQLVAARAYSS